MTDLFDPKDEEKGAPPPVPETVRFEDSIAVGGYPGHATAAKVKIEFSADLLKKRLGEKKYEALQKAKQRKGEVKKRYIEPPKGYQRMGDAYLASPVADGTGSSGPSFWGVVGDSVAPDLSSAAYEGDLHPSPPAKVRGKVHNPLADMVHAPSLEVPLMQDRGSDYGDYAKVLGSWKWWLSSAGLAYLSIALFYRLTHIKQWLKSRWHGVELTSKGMRPVGFKTWFMYKTSGLRYQLKMAKRMGLKRYLRWRKVKKTPAPRREVSWLAELRQPDGSYRADMSDPFPNLTKMLEIGLAAGFDPGLIYSYWLSTDFAAFVYKKAEKVPQLLDDKVQPEPSKGIDGLSNNDLHAIVADIQKFLDEKFPKTHPELAKIILNGVPKIVFRILSYEEIAWLVKKKFPSVTYRGAAGLKAEGILSPGQSIEVQDGTKISAITTGNA